jgi:hypothetical protein
MEHIICQIGNLDETVVHLHMPLNHTVVDDVTKFVVMKKLDDKGCNYHVGSIGGQWQFVVIFDIIAKPCLRGGATAQRKRCEMPTKRLDNQCWHWC